MKKISVKKPEGEIPVEHERRWKIDLRIFIAHILFINYPAYQIEQGYIKQGGGRRNIRIRRQKDQKNGEELYTLTVKSEKGISRREDERKIDEKIYRKLKGKVECSLVKTRYKIPYQGIIIELDIFSDGYVHAEIEFPSHAEAVAYIAPSFFGDDVTAVSGHGCHALAKYGIPKD